MAAEHEICQDVLPAVLAPPGGRALAGTACLCPAPGYLQLRRVEDVPAHDPLMVVLDQILGELAVVLDHLFADAVLDKGLLEQRITAVFLVAQNTQQVLDGPLLFSYRVQGPLCLQLALDGPQGISGQIPLIDKADGLRLLLVDHRPSVRALLIPKHPLVLHRDMAGFHGPSLPPADIGAGVLTFRLGEGAVYGDEELALRIDGVDILFLKDDRDTQFPQFSGIIEGVHRIPCEPGNGFGQDHVDLSLAAHPDHLEEFLPLTGGGAGLALIREHLYHGPAGVLHDLLGVVGKLVFIAGELLLAVGGYTAVGRYPQVPLLGLLLGRFLLGWDHNDFRGGFCHGCCPPFMIWPFFSRT